MSRKTRHLSEPTRACATLDQLLGVTLVEACPTDATKLVRALARACRRGRWRRAGVQRAGLVLGCLRRLRTRLGDRFVEWRRSGRGSEVVARDGEELVVAAIVRAAPLRIEADFSDPIAVELLRPDLFESRRFRHAGVGGDAASRGGT